MLSVWYNSFLHPASLSVYSIIPNLPSAHSNYQAAAAANQSATLQQATIV